MEYFTRPRGRFSEGTGPVRNVTSAPWLFASSASARPLRISRSDHMALEVEDLEAVKKELDAAGVAYQLGSNDALGFSQVFCSDPDGHTIEFVRYF